MKSRQKESCKIPKDNQSQDWLEGIAAQRINKLRYVEVENCRLNRKLVSSHPNYQLKLTKFYQGIGGEDCLDLGRVLNKSWPRSVVS